MSALRRLAWRICDATMRRRAGWVAARLAPALPRGGALLDIGSGTGHNGAAIAAGYGARVVQADLADMHMVGRRPLLFDRRLPLRDAALETALLAYVLQYPDQPAATLREAARVARRVLVLQSVCAGPAGRLLLGLHEIAWGPLALVAARAAGLVRPRRFTLATRRLYSDAALRALAGAAGLRVAAAWPRPWWPGAPVGDTLYLLEADDGQ